jgi:hypothetical protein
VPEICYDRVENGSRYEEVVAENTSDEGHMVEQVRDTGHYEDRLKWDRKGVNLFGHLGIRGIGQVN